MVKSFFLVLPLASSGLLGDALDWLSQAPATPEDIPAIEDQPTATPEPALRPLKEDITAASNPVVVDATVKTPSRRSTRKLEDVPDVQLATPTEAPIDPAYTVYFDPPADEKVEISPPKIVNYSDPSYEAPISPEERLRRQCNYNMGSWVKITYTDSWHFKLGQVQPPNTRGVCTIATYFPNDPSESPFQVVDEPYDIISNISIRLTGREIHTTKIFDLFQLLTDPIWNRIEEKTTVWRFLQRNLASRRENTVPVNFQAAPKEVTDAISDMLGGSGDAVYAAKFRSAWGAADHSYLEAHNDHHSHKQTYRLSNPEL